MLRRAIISGELDSGTHLVESVLSDRFQVSRAPIREALKELEGEGLVESRRRGVYVKALTPEDVREIHSLRRVLEGAALELAVQRFDEADVAELDRHVAAMEEAAADGRVNDFAAADLLFHRALFERAGNRRLLRVWQSFSRTVRIITEITDAGDVDYESVAADHRRILDAIGRHDLDAAQRKLAASLSLGERVFEQRFEPYSHDGVEAAKGGGRD
jgi:GntR family transcriptional regulator of gluconate operon